MSETNTENNRPLTKSLEVDGKNYSLTLDGENDEYYIPGEKFNYVEREFSGELEGVTYFAPQAKTVAAAIELYGEDITLGLINDRLLFGLALKAKGKIPKYEGEEAKAQRESAIRKIIASRTPVVTPDDAENFKPGTRELSIKGLFNKVTEAQKNGQKALAMELMEKAMAMLRREQALS